MRARASFVASRTTGGDKQGLCIRNNNCTLLHFILIDIYCIKKNALDRIITLETDFEGLGNLWGFFSMNPTPWRLYY
jgi:hypothetical protein